MTISSFFELIADTEGFFNFKGKEREEGRERKRKRERKRERKGKRERKRRERNWQRAHLFSGDLSMRRKDRLHLLQIQMVVLSALVLNLSLIMVAH